MIRVTDEPDVTDAQEPSLESRVDVLQESVEAAHRHLGRLQQVVSTNEAQVILLAIGLLCICGAVYLLGREGVTVSGPDA